VSCILVAVSNRSCLFTRYPLSCLHVVLNSLTDVCSYSVGTRRPCIIEPSLIERCDAIMDINGVKASTHDQRMVAEIFLYSKLYSLLQLQGAGDPSELHAWREKWDYLFRIVPCSTIFLICSRGSSCHGIWIRPCHIHFLSILLACSILRFTLLLVLYNFLFCWTSCFF
jgi:hypothetical protein